MAGDMLDTAISGLLAYQRALNTTGHNIANANTPGYTRQRVELSTRPPSATGNGYIGNGVQIDTVRRVYDSFVDTQLRTTTSSFGEAESFHRLAAQVDALLADSKTGLTPTLQEFFSAVHGVANDPASAPARQVMLSTANTLVERFHTIDQRLDQMSDAIDSDLQATVTEINGLASAIADINRSITTTGGFNGQAPNDLLDKRDQLLRELAGQVSVTTVQQDNGALNVFVGNGQSLVLGSDSNPLSVTTNQYDVSRTEIAITVGASSVVVSDYISGGHLGGVLEFRRQVLDPSFNALGRVAAGLAETFNAQHRDGMDLSGALGGDFFTTPTIAVLPGQVGAGAVSASITDANQLTTSDYLVRYEGAGTWSVARLSDNTSQSGAGPLSIDGLTITVGGAPAVGETFLIQPTRNGAEDIGLAITDTRNIAAAAPIRTNASLSNTGLATISAGEVLDSTDANLLTTTTINFLGANTYQINGAGAVLAYTSGGNIDVNGWRVQVSGTPAAGDVFTVQSNAGGVGDNRNALNLAGLQSRMTLANGSASYEGAYGQLVADIGSSTHRAEVNKAAQNTLLQSATAERESVSGVNLDEEAADMLRYQQAYQAAAQMIAVTDTIFQTLLSAVRR